MILLFLRLGSISVYQVAEARNAECAREMLERKDWIVPVFNGKLRTDKPALEYFAMMAAYQTGGVSEGSARFFSAVCGLLLVLSTFFITLKFSDKKTAWWSALILLASAHFIIQFRLATPDPYLILCDTLALYCFLLGWKSGKWIWYALMYILLGLAMLAKGPVGLLLPALILCLFLIVKKNFNWKIIKSLKPWWGILLLLLFSAPWYILVHLKTNGDWTKGFFLKHNIDRFSGAMGGHGGIFLLTFLFVFIGMLPFSIFIIHTLKFVWNKISFPVFRLSKTRQSLKKREVHSRQNDLLLLSFLAFVCIVLFYTISRTKLINYTVPCYPFIAIMTGAFLTQLTRSSILPKGLHLSYVLLLIITFALPVGAYFWTQSVPGLHSFGWVAWFFLFFPIGALWAYVLFLQKKVTQSLHIIAASFMLSLVLLFAYPYPVLDAQTPMRKAQSLFYPGRPVIVYQRFNDAFVFYIKHPVPVVNDTIALKQFLSDHPDALVISDIKDQTDLQHISGLQLLRKDHEVFNSHTSFIYKKVPLPNHK